MLGNGNVRVSKGFRFPRGLPFPRFFGNRKAAENLGLLSSPIIVKFPILTLAGSGSRKPTVTAGLPLPKPLPNTGVA